MNRVQEISIILAEVDPSDLISCGAPQDEYAVEAASLAELEKAGALTTDSIVEVFQLWFGEHSPFAGDANKDKLHEIFNKITA